VATIIDGEVTFTPCDDVMAKLIELADLAAWREDPEAGLVESGGRLVPIFGELT
jgi:hypothetical protein